VRRLQAASERRRAVADGDRERAASVEKLKRLHASEVKKR
jgi:hypothetical protein